MSQRAILSAALVFAAAGALSACGSTGILRSDENRTPGQSRNADTNESGGLNPFNWGGGGNRGATEGAQIGVNSFLWRASLDTLNFMPLASEDPFGGVIITDWYADPATPDERFKATVYILDSRLRADALNVSVFRQTRTEQGWIDASVSPDTSIQIENAILTRARQLRLSTLR